MDGNNSYPPPQSVKEASDTADWLESMSPVVLREAEPWLQSDIVSAKKCSRSERAINAIYRTPQMSFSVSQGCEECSIKAAQSNQLAFHLCISHRPLESVSHCRHTPTGTVILDTKEQKGRQGDTEMHKVLRYESSEQLADKWCAPLWSQPRL